MSILIAFILGMMLIPCRGWSQEGGMSSAVSSLQSVLSNLKDSVDRLSVDNDQWAARDNAIKAQVEQLRQQLVRLQDQGDQLNQSSGKLQDKNSRRTQQIIRLEQENADLDDRRRKAGSLVKLIRQSLNAGYQEEQRLLMQLSGAPDPSASQSPQALLAARHQKEKLQLVKMIYDSQQRQLGLNKSILEIQSNAPLLPSAKALAHQQILKDQISTLEAQIAAYQPKKPAVSAPLESVNPWDEAQLRQLEGELRDLEENYTQLKKLTAQMSQKAQSPDITIPQRLEGEKLKTSLDDLVHQGDGLRVELDDLRSQMVDLDKRKSRLESMIQRLP